MTKQVTAAVGPVEKAAQREMGQMAAQLLEQAARLERISRRVKKTPGWREGMRRLRQMDTVPAGPDFVHTVAFECVPTCDEAVEKLREHAEYLTQAAKATPRSLAAGKRARERRSEAYDKREAKRRASGPAACALDALLPSNLSAKLRGLVKEQLRVAPDVRAALAAEPLNDHGRAAAVEFIKIAEAIGAFLQTLTETRPKAAA